MPPNGFEGTTWSLDHYNRALFRIFTRCCENSCVFWIVPQIADVGNLFKINRLRASMSLSGNVPLKHTPFPLQKGSKWQGRHDWEQGNINFPPV